MGKLTDEEFRDFLKTCRELAEGPFEEMQREVEVTNKFPQEFIDLGPREQPVPLRAARGVRRMGLHREGDPAGAGGVLPGPGRHAHAPALRRRPELAHPGRLRLRRVEGRLHGQICRQDHLHLLRAHRADWRHRRRRAHHRRERRGWELHSERREVAHLPHRRSPVRLRHRRDRPGQGGRRAPLRLLRAHGRRGLRARGHAAYDGLPRRGARRLQNDRREARAEVPARQGRPGHGSGHALAGHLPRAHRRLEPRHVPAHAGDVCWPGRATA